MINYLTRLATRTTLTLALLLILSSAATGRSQGVVLNPNDSWSFHFSTLHYVRTEVGTLDFIHAAFSFTATDEIPPSGQPHSLLLYSLFEGMPLDGMFHTHGILTGAPHRSVY
jgi:hypothetical protein